MGYPERNAMSATYIIPGTDSPLQLAYPEELEVHHHFLVVAANLVVGDIVPSGGPALRQQPPGLGVPPEHVPASGRRRSEDWTQCIYAMLGKIRRAIEKEGDVV